MCSASRNSPFHQATPLHPVTELLERTTGFARDDPTAHRLDVLGGGDGGRREGRPSERPPSLEDAARGLLQGLGR